MGEETQILIDTLRGEVREEKEYARALEESKADAERLLSKAIGERVDVEIKLRSERDRVLGEVSHAVAAREGKGDRESAAWSLGSEEKL